MEERDDLLKRAMVEAFGESSSSSSDETPNKKQEDDDEGEEGVRGRRTWTWEPAEPVDGLWLCRDFLSEEDQSSLLSAIEQEGWFTKSSHNQAMRFGDLPQWATELSRFVREAVCFSEVSSKGGQRLIMEDQLIEEPCPLPFDLLWREPLFDQLILNIYKPYEGICAHVDLMRFQDGIAIVSLESACVMHFTRSEGGADAAETRGKEGSSARIPVFLNPGSLVLMSGEARYLWKHEINRKAGFQVWEGKEIDQERRTSITLRRLCERS